MAGRESSTATVMFHTAIAEKAGLTASDTKTMDILTRHGALTAGELAVHTGLATASITALTDRLEAKGLVRRVRDPGDRRRVIVEPVAEKIAGAGAFFGAIRNAFEAVVADYSDEQLATILDFMRRSTERTREITAALTRKDQRGGRRRAARPSTEK